MLDQPGRGIIYCNFEYHIFHQIRVLEGNIQKAEAEICRLDALVEKIRLVSSNMCYDLSGSGPFTLSSAEAPLRKMSAFAPALTLFSGYT